MDTAPLWPHTAAKEECERSQAGLYTPCPPCGPEIQIEVLGPRVDKPCRAITAEDGQTNCAQMLTCKQMMEVMAKEEHKNEYIKTATSKKKRKKKLRPRKDALILASALYALGIMPRRVVKGAIYPSFNWITEWGYRAVIKVVDHHYLLSWDELRHLYPPMKPPSDGVYRPVQVGEHVKGEFVSYSPSVKAERRHGGRHGIRLEDDYERDKVENNTTIFVIHGGGFCMGDVTTYRRWGVKMSKLLGGIQFFFMDYGLSPENQFPTALRQCWKTYLWLIDEKGGNIPPERLIVAGDSAGGNLTLSLLFLIRQARLEKEKREMKLRGEYQSDEDCDEDLDALGDPDMTRDCNPHAVPHRRDRRGTMELWMEREEDRIGRDIRDRFGKDLPHWDEGAGNDRSGSTTTRDGTTDSMNRDEIKRRREYRRKMSDDVRAQWRRKLMRDKRYMRRHRLPFELDENEKELFPPFPVCAMLLSPWVDLSEHSSAFRWNNYPKPASFRPYHIGLRFVHAYLGLQPSDYPFTARKNRELERRFKYGIEAQKKERKTKREKDRARARAVKIHAQAEYLRTVMCEELRMRQFDQTRQDLKQHRRRQRRMSVDMHNVKEGTTRRYTGLRRHNESSDAGPDLGGATRSDLEREEEEEDLEVNRRSIYSPYVSPIYGDLLGLPPMLVTGGDEEPLWDDIQKLIAKGRDQGLEVEVVVGEQMNHDFQFFFEIVAHPEVAKFLDRVKEWFHLQLEIIGEGDEVDRLKRKGETIASQDAEEAKAHDKEDVVDKSKQLLHTLSRLPSLSSVL